MKTCHIFFKWFFFFLLFLSFHSFSQTTIWMKILEPKELNSGFNLIKTKSDNLNNLYMVGGFGGKVNFNTGLDSFYYPNNTLSGIFISKYNNSGLLTWAISLKKKSGLSINSQVVDFIIDKSNNIIIYGTGCYSDFNPSVSDSLFLNKGTNGNAFVAKYDGVNGSLLWAKAIEGFVPSNLGYNNITTTSINVDAANNIYFTGSFKDTIDVNPDTMVSNKMVAVAGRDIFMAKWDANGNYIWSKQIAGSKDEQANCIEIGTDNKIYLAGYYQQLTDFDPSSTGFFSLNTNILNVSSDCFVAKYDTSGNFVWAKGFGGIGRDEIINLKLDINNNIYYTGTYQDSVNFNPGVGNNSYYAIPPNGDTLTYNQSFYSKTDNLGNFKWVRRYNGYTNIKCIDVDNIGNFNISGSTGNIGVNLDTTNTNLLVPPNSNNTGFGFFAFYNANKICTYKMVVDTGSNLSWTNFIHKTANNEYYCTGQAYKVVYPAPFSANYTSYTNPYGRFIYLYKMNNWPLSTQTIEKKAATFYLYPNPSTDLLTFESINTDLKPIQINIYNALGQLAFTQKFEKTISVSFLSRGTYFYTALDKDGNQYSNTFIKE